MGAVIAFPLPAPAPVIQPAEVIWFSGGSLHVRYGAHVHHMEPHIAMERREFWTRQCISLADVPDADEERRAAARNWHAITAALDALDEHCRIVGKPGVWP